MSNPMIEAQAVHKTYVLTKTEVRVLRGASLRVEAGESVAIVGKSGAGKSTLMHILGGLDRPDQGRIFIDGEDLYGISPGRRTSIRFRKIGFVFQSYHLLPEMDVSENVMLPAMARTRLFTSAAALRRRARDLLEAVGLSDRADHTPFELSGGEQQRVALARALMNDPMLVLADEPTGNLDDATGGQILEYLFALTRDRGHALVLVTHNAVVAARCDRMLVLRDGLLVPP